MICHDSAIASLPATESHSRANDFEICAAANDRIDESVRLPLSSKSHHQDPAISWTTRLFFSPFFYGASRSHSSRKLMVRRAPFRTVFGENERISGGATSPPRCEET